MNSSGPGDDEDEREGEAASASMSDEDDPMNPAAWYREPDICGSCIAWRPDDPRPGEDVAAGECKLRRELGRVPATLKKCNIYKPRGQFRYEPGHAPARTRKRASTLRVLRRSAEGELVSERAPPKAPVPAILRREKDVEVELEHDPRFPPEKPEQPSGDTGPRPDRPRREVPTTLDLGGDEHPAAVRQALVELLRKEHGRTTTEIHSKFRTGGKVIATAPGGATTSVSAERFFAVLDRYRASLIALEKCLSAQPALEEDREELMSQIRRMQGSFTTFNFMFQDREDYFSGKE